MKGEAVARCGSAERNPTGIHEDAGSIPCLTSRLRIWCHDPDPRAVVQVADPDQALPWLWCRLAATAPIQPLAWELPYATDAA